jgi:hypothetical protein
MPHPLVKLRPGSINVDVPPSEVVPEEWTSGVNFQFKDGFANRSLGWDAIFPATSQPPIHTINARQTGSYNYWISCQPDGVFVTNGGSAWVDITPDIYTYTADPNAWTSALLNGIPVINNGINPPFYWDLVGIMLPLPGWPAATACRAIRSFKYHLVAMHINDFQDQYIWSDAAAPGSVPLSWEPTPSTDSGDNILSATRGAIIDGAKLRGQFMLWKSHSGYRMNYVGGTFVMATQKFLSNSGVLSRNCIAEVEGYQAIFTDGDIIRTDGQNVTSIIDRRAKSTIFSQISSEFYERSYVVTNRPRNEVLFCFPTTDAPDGYPDLALVWDYARDRIGFRDINSSPYMAAGTVFQVPGDNEWNQQIGSWDEQTRIWGQSTYRAADDGVLMLQNSPQMYRLDGSATAAGVGVDSRIRREYLDFGAPGDVKTLSRVWPRITAPEGTNISVRVGGQMTPDNPVTWSDYIPYLPEADDFVSVFATGRGLSFEFSSIGGQAFQLEGFDVELTARGRF